VNSTRIRELLSQGKPEQVVELLGRHYAVRGTVVEGDRRGRTLGFPTANFSLDAPDQVLPERGVYAGEVRFLDDGDPIRGAVHSSVANVGTRPTVDDSERVTLEAHLLDFEGDVYGRRVEFAFRHHLRPERKFPSVDALQEQIRADVALGRDRLEAS
jgi:riboflavin kinase/FMN adenylyltransferase